MISVFLIGLAAFGIFANVTLEKNAEAEVLQQASIMMDAALAIRSYTVKEIRPLLSRAMKRIFLPQSVPSYAATTNFKKLRDKYPEYVYKEATLNPTNPADRAVDWEADIVQNFRNHPENKQILGTRQTPTGPSLFLARPIQINDVGCLVCHSTPNAAPKTMIKKYGAANGFGWNLKEIVGAQIVSVPLSVPIQKAREVLILFMSTMAGIGVASLILMNLMLHFMIVKPIKEVSAIADQISTGNMDAPEFASTGKDEISKLAQSFNRMRRSVDKALKMLD